MSQIRISRPALDEVERALQEYEALLTQLRADRIIRENTQETYLRYAEMFVRWLRDEFDPAPETSESASVLPVLSVANPHPLYGNPRSLTPAHAP